MSDFSALDDAVRRLEESNAALHAEVVARLGAPEKLTERQQKAENARLMSSEYARNAERRAAAKRGDQGGDQ